MDGNRRLEEKPQVASRGMKLAKVAPVEHEEVKLIGIPNDQNDSLNVPVEEQRGGHHRGSVVHVVRGNVRTVFHRTGWYDSVLAVTIRKFIRGKAFAVAAGIALILALFLGELFAVAQVSGNTALDVILTFVFALFAFEFLGLSLTDASYLLSFFFWMDLLGTVSMVFDISYMLGPDATEPYRVNREDATSGGNNVVIVRAARAAKLGARAGRISRVMKLLHFLPFFINNNDDNQKVKVAKVISNQLTNVLSTRVAFTTIVVVVVLPVFGMFTYPEVDDSMGAWTELLALNADGFHKARASGDTVAEASATQRLNRELTRFADFYSTLSYGPYAVSYGKTVHGTFVKEPGILSFDFQSSFSEPRRKSSIRVVSQGRIETSFDMATPKQQEAGSNIGLICFIILVMCCFGVVMSNSISVIALQPLERMLSMVRKRCAQIFKYTSDLEDEEDSKDGDEDYDDNEQDSEFVLLEKVVKKLAAIANLSTANQAPEMKADMTENEIMTLNWMQGAQVPSISMRNSTKPVTDSPSNAKMEDSTTPRTPKVSSPLCTISQDIIDSLDTPNFNPLDLTKEVKIAVAVHIVTSSEGTAAWVRSNVRENTLRIFVTILESKYKPNPFHNFAHALDVEYAVSRYMWLAVAREFLPEISQFWLMIAAIAHDIGHTAVNNQYLVETTHELALRYNDRSPLENMHCAKLFQIISEPDANVFGQLEKNDYKEARNGIITTILHTDVTKHSDMIKELGMFYQMNSEEFDRCDAVSAIKTQSNIQLILNALLHGADIGNPTKPWDLCYRYAYLCLDEFFDQGDLEKAAGIPVQMLNDRDKVNRPNSQVGFIEFVILPMVVAMVNIFPQLDSLADFLSQNLQNWADVWQGEVTPSADVIAKLNGRVQKVANTCKGLMRS